MFQCWGFQRNVLDELRNGLDAYVSKAVPANESRAVVLFDDPTDDDDLGVGGEAGLIVRALAESIDTPFVQIEPFSWPLDVFRASSIQLAAAEVLRDSGEVEGAIGKIPIYESIVTVGYLLTRVAGKLPHPLVVHIGPLEAYPGDHYGIQDLIHYLIDYSKNLFAVISTSEKYWQERGRRKTVWHKVKDRLRPFLLENRLRPVRNLEEFRKLLRFLAEKGAVPPDAERLATAIWKNSPSRTVGQLKQAAITKSMGV